MRTDVWWMHCWPLVPPEWIRDAEGWVDEHGWGLIGPEFAGAGEDD